MARLEKTFRVNQPVLQVCAQAVEQLVAELLLNASAGIQQCITLLVLVWRGRRRVGKHDAWHKRMNDFAPDAIARQVPELNKLLELREALVALKGPLGNVPAFRKQLQTLLADDKARIALAKELNLVLDKPAA